LQALAWNRRICRFDTGGCIGCALHLGAAEREKPGWVTPHRVRVPMRGTEADPLVVVMKAL
jgi:hypothetical protein